MLKHTLRICAYLAQDNNKDAFKGRFSKNDLKIDQRKNSNKLSIQVHLDLGNIVT